jgi:hypothetical protein
MSTIQPPAEVAADLVANELAELKAVGRLMRQAQRDYFRDRTTEARQRSKGLERRFDALVKPVERDAQSRLF